MTKDKIVSGLNHQSSDNNGTTKSMKTKEKIIEEWKRDLIFDLGNLVSPEAIIIIFGKIDELLSLQTQKIVEEIEKQTIKEEKQEEWEKEGF